MVLSTMVDKKELELSTDSTQSSDSDTVESVTLLSNDSGFPLRPGGSATRQENAVAFSNPSPIYA